MMDRDSRILVVNAQAFIRSAIARVLETHGYTCVSRLPGKPSELPNLSSVDSFFAHRKPEYVFLSAEKSAAGFEGNFIFDAARPDGVPIKLLNTSKLKAMKWESTLAFQKALDTTYAWFLAGKNTCIGNAAFEQMR